MRARYYRLLSFIMIMSFLSIVSCLNEPEYLTVKKTEVPKPVNLNIKQNDAFSLLISWFISVDSSELITQFQIETFASDSQLTMTSIKFTSYMHDSPNSRQILLNDDELLFQMLPSEDTIKYSFIDTGSIFNAKNYYRVTVVSDDIISYSLMADSGFVFQLGEPQKFNILQVNDHQLQASWNATTFANGYEIFRYDTSGSLDTSFIVADTFYFDSSYNPILNIEESEIYFSVEGLHPNVLYNYSIRAFSDNESERRYSHRNSSLENVSLSLLYPRINKTRPKNSNTTRIYIQSSSIDTHIDSIFVFSYNSTVGCWEVRDTAIVTKLNSMIDNDMLSYHVIDIQNTAESKFIILAKSKVNGLFSNDTIGDVFPFHNYERIEGGFFKTTSQWIDSFYFSSVEYGEPYAFIDTSLINPILASDPIFPDDSISWVEAVILCDEYSLSTGYEVRLPSEFEWEYAALKDVFSDDRSWQYDYPWGSDTISSEYANYINSGDLWDNYLTPVAHYNGENGTNDNSSSFGVYDLAGNILEWCGSGSCSIDMASININDKSMIGDHTRELRGGGFWHESTLLRSNLTDQFLYDGELSVLGFGFRILIEESE